MFASRFGKRWPWGTRWSDRDRKTKTRCFNDKARLPLTASPKCFRKYCSSFWSVFELCGCVRSFCGESACVSIFQGQRKTRATVCCAVVGVCVWQCVGVRDSGGVAHSTGHVCGKHCMHAEDRWKSRGGWAGSKNKRNTSSDLSDGYRLAWSDIGKGRGGSRRKSRGETERGRKAEQWGRRR